MWAGVGSGVHLVEQALELPILVVSELAGDDGPGSGEEEQLAGLMQVADLIGGEQGPTGMVGGVGEIGPGPTGAVQGAVMVVDAEDLQDPGIAEEGAGALSVGGAELVDILKDGPP